MCRRKLRRMLRRAWWHIPRIEIPPGLQRQLHDNIALTSFPRFRSSTPIPAGEAVMVYESGRP